jgi:hypothetical protein
MGAVWLCARAQLRGRVLASLVLALLVGLAGGIALAALAGAHRSDTALARFLAASDTVDARVVWDTSGGGLTDQPDLAAQLAGVAALPQVRTAQRVAFVIVSVSDPTGPSGPARQLALVGLDRPGHEELGRPVLVAGRWPRPDRAEEAVVDEEFATRHKLGVGGLFRVGIYTRAQFGQAAGGVFVPPKGPAAELRVAGIVRFPKDLVPLAEGSSQSDTDRSGDLYLTPGFWRRYGPDLASSRIDLAVELQRGFTDEEAFDETVIDRFGDQANLAVVSGGREEEPALLAGVQRAIAFETAALLLFGVLALLSMVLLVSQTLGRQMFLAAAEDPTLRALGMTRRQLVGVALVRAALIGAGAAALAVAAAVALSPLTPIGLARLAEPAPGVTVDWPVLALGALVIVAVVGGCAALPAWRAARLPGDPLGVMDLAGPLRPSRLAARLGGAAVPPTVALGVRLALEPGRGRTAVPVRAALAGTVAAVCAVTAAASFGASLAHLAATPPAYGVTWDLSVGSFTSAATAEPVAKRLVSHPEVAAAAAMLSQLVSINGQDLPVVAVEPRKGWVPAPVVQGRQPTSLEEIALGSTTLRSLHKQVGDRVIVGDLWFVESARVVGRAMLHPGRWNNWTPLGEGAIVHPALLDRLTIAVWPQTFLVRLNPGIPRDQAIARLRRDFPGAITISGPPAEVRDLQRVAELPALLAALVALVALATLTDALGSSVRRRRRDLAILKTLGFLRGQLAATIAWQATTFAVLALALGIPLGVAAGRWAWRLTTSQLGLGSVQVVPLPAILAAAAGTVLAANLVAAIPGRVASRLHPATALRSE